MAVLKEQRGRDIGRQLLKAAVDHAVEVGLQRVFLHAQTHAEGFYRKSGFLPFGAEFMEAGIPHIEMELALPIPFKGSARDRELPLVKAASTPGEAVSRAAERSNRNPNAAMVSSSCSRARGARCSS